MSRVSRMRWICASIAFALCLAFFSSSMAAQKSSLPSAPDADPALIAGQVAGQLYSALLGHWAGMLEYRKFPSEKRLLLPAWLDVTEAADGKSLTMRYTFDDGTNDVIRETQRVTVSPTLRIWTEKPVAQPEDVYKVDGLEKLKDGTFMKAFTDKGRLSQLLINMPVRIILESRAALLGAAAYAEARAAEISGVSIRAASIKV